MIIEETEFCYPLDVTDVSDEEGEGLAIEMLHPSYDDMIINVDKQQAAQLIEVLQKWIDGEGVE
ncbi:hypothetical protein MKK42_18065 [Escherichia coli]|uniref:hypothetical protein n=1 Tax=Escherichia coli TaxID=562 RepID=UPI001F566100|nr:hypothetical protein [Escherichia coli]MCI2234001.1 hypothetical protein [Escherichia coli]